MTVFPMLLDAPTALARLQDGSATLVDVREHAEVTREAFAAMDIVELREYEADLAEGSGHHGRSALIGLVARQRGA